MRKKRKAELGGGVGGFETCKHARMQMSMYRRNSQTWTLSIYTTTCTSVYDGVHHHYSTKCNNFNDRRTSRGNDNHSFSRNSSSRPNNKRRKKNMKRKKNFILFHFFKSDEQQQLHLRKCLDATMVTMKSLWWCSAFDGWQLVDEKRRRVTKWFDSFHTVLSSACMYIIEYSLPV